MKGSTKLWLSVGVITIASSCLIWGWDILTITTYIIATIAALWVGLCTVATVLYKKGIAECFKTDPIIIYSSLIGWLYLCWLGLKWINVWADKHLGI